LSYLADTQTDKQTNKVWQKHNLFGGGKYLLLTRRRTAYRMRFWIIRNATLKRREFFSHPSGSIDGADLHFHTGP